MVDFKGSYLVTVLFLAVMFQSQLHASINILNSGAKGDCVANDAPAINAAIQSLANGATHSGEVSFQASGWLLPGG